MKSRNGVRIITTTGGHVEKIDYSDARPDVACGDNRRSRRVTAVCNRVASRWPHNDAPLVLEEIHNGRILLALSMSWPYDNKLSLSTVTASNAKVRTYVWGSDLSGSMQGAGGIGGLLKVTQHGSQVTHHFVAYDGNGNVMGLVNTADGSLSARYEYGPFGEPIRISGAISILNPIRFSSKYTDDQSGLVYYGYRYYNPSTGRWMSRDPVAEGGGGINLFVSMNNNPIISYDPVGLRTVSVSLRVDWKVRSPYEWSAPWSRDWVAARLEIEELGGCSISGAPTTEIRGGSRYLWAGPSFIPTTWLYKKKSGKCPCDLECAQLKLVRACPKRPGF
ncbi:MAG: RHS repeat-associated core domain-containing protein [Verrucomicrobia bacterium]|nr:RHS repeat-associated core domain-containing protein [Verrucomicrobiota bacterium]